MEGGFLTAPAPGNVTQLLQDLTEGDQDALDRLIPLVYRELRSLAGRAIRRERGDHTLDATALVHEAYLRLADQHKLHWQHRAQFFGVAAQMMRRVLVDHARRHMAAKRGGSRAKLTLDDGVIAAGEKSVDVAALDEALTRLSRFDPQQCRIVELRYFGGLTIEETASVVGISPATVKRDWTVAKAWLRREITGEDTDD